MNYILFTGILQIVLAMAFIGFGKQKQKADYLLLLFLGCIGLHLGAKFYIFTTVNNDAVTFRMHTAIQLAYGPLLYLYARKRSNLSFMPSGMWYLFIPLIVVVTLYTCTSLAIFKYPAQGTVILQFYNTIVFLPIVLSHIVFGLIAPTGDNRKGNDYIFIKLLKYIVIVLGVTEIALLALGDMDAAINPYIRSVLYILLGSVPVLVFWLKTNTSTTVINKEVSKTTHHPADAENRKLTLDTEKHEAIFNQLELLLQDKQLYKDEDLSLEKLAAASNINRHHISETLNVFAKKSFYQYINEYRIKEVVRLLDSNHKKNIRLLTVAYDCGFKTKASFNQYFKSLTGTTPSGYLKEKAA